MIPIVEPNPDDRPETSPQEQSGRNQRPAEPAGPSATTRRLPLVALAVLTAVLIGLCALLAYPFLPAITWGVALAILAWPMHRAIARRIARPRLAAGLSTAAVVAVILVPGLFVAYQITREAAVAAERMNQGAAG